MIKQVIVVRKDLNMRKGKIAAQSCHASLKIFFDRMERYYNSLDMETDTFMCHMTPDMVEWKEGAFTKICLYVNSEEELLDIVRLSKQAGLPTALITDSGKTEFNGVPTNTCCAIGPAMASKIDVITGELNLY